MLDILTIAKNLDIFKLSTFEIIIGAILIVAALLIIFVVLLQEGRQANVGVISGAADSFMDKGAAKTLDQKLAKWTKVIAIVFFLLVLGGMMVSKFFTNEAINRREYEKSQKTATSQTVSAVASTSTTASTTTTTKASVTEDEKADADQDKAEDNNTDADANKDEASK